MIWGISARDLCQSIWDKVIAQLGNDGFTLYVTYSIKSYKIYIISNVIYN